MENRYEIYPYLTLYIKINTHTQLDSQGLGLSDREISKKQKLKNKEDIKGNSGEK